MSKTASAICVKNYITTRQYKTRPIHQLGHIFCKLWTYIYIAIGHIHFHFGFFFWYSVIPIKSSTYILTFGHFEPIDKYTLHPATLFFALDKLFNWAVMAFSSILKDYGAVVPWSGSFADCGTLLHWELLAWTPRSWQHPQKLLSPLHSVSKPDFSHTRSSEPATKVSKQISVPTVLVQKMISNTLETTVRRDHLIATVYRLQ